MLSDGPRSLELMPLAIVWYNWRERNCQIFEVKATCFQVFNFLITFYSWGEVLDHDMKLAFLDLVDMITRERLRV